MSEARLPRLEWLDLARGLGVILVVLGHVLSGLTRAGQFPDGPLATWTEYALYTFHMPLFFFLTGLNAPHSLQRGPKSFLAAKGWTIAYPYMLWSLLQGGGGASPAAAAAAARPAPWPRRRMRQQTGAPQPQVAAMSPDRLRSVPIA